MGTAGSAFIERVFGDNAGYLHLVTILDNVWSSRIYEYPEELDRLDKELDELADETGVNVYFYPVLTEHADDASNIVCSPVVTTDLGMIQPTLVAPRPCLVIESSPNRYQAYWFKSTYGDALKPTSVNGSVDTRIRLCRVPGTFNWKYDKHDGWLVTVADLSKLDTFDKVVSRLNLDNQSFNHLFRINDRWSLARLCAKLGANTMETFTVLEAAQTAMETRAPGAKVATLPTIYKEAASAVGANRAPSFLTEEELGTLPDPNSFVGRYVEWATRRTDSPRQYHVAGALLALSAVLSPYIRFPTMFGEFRVNLWFLILAGTTMTRKTTATDMAVDLIKTIDLKTLMGTSGSAEGIITELADRDGTSSLFYRDEVNGFIEEISDKRYMSGFIQTLTKLYDGGSERRALSKKVIEVNDPHFLMMCGGIKGRTMELLEAQHIESGFLPRFIMVCGWTSPEDIKPIGPPAFNVEDERGELVDYLINLGARYMPTGALARVRKVPAITRVTATDAAWSRIRQLESDVAAASQKANDPNTFGPLYERLKNSIYKVATLLTADRAYRTSCDPIMETTDIVDAISYAGVWIESMHEIAEGIMDKPSQAEKLRTRVAETISNANGGIQRSELMRRFRLGKRDTDEIIGTLIERKLIAEIKMDNRATGYTVPTDGD